MNRAPDGPQPPHIQWPRVVSDANYAAEVVRLLLHTAATVINAPVMAGGSNRIPTPEYTARVLDETNRLLAFQIAFMRNVAVAMAARHVAFLQDEPPPAQPEWAQRMLEHAFDGAAASAAPNAHADENEYRVVSNALVNMAVIAAARRGAVLVGKPAESLDTYRPPTEESLSELHRLIAEAGARCLDIPLQE